MHYIKTAALSAFAAVSVSAFPLGSRTADIIPHPADDLLKRNSALDVTNDKRYYGRQILSSRDAEANLSPNSLHVPSPDTSKYIKRILGDDDPWIDLDDLFVTSIQIGAAGDGNEESSAPSAGDLIV